MLLRTLIVDDEPLAGQRLERLLQAEPSVTVAATCCDGREAMKAVQEHSPDVVFLDVHMPEMNGFDFLKAIPAPRPLIVFVTAHEKYAVPAFEAHAVDFLLKPFDRERLRGTLRRVRQRLQNGVASKKAERPANDSREDTATDEKWQRVAIKQGGRVLFLKLDEIDWIGVADNYVELHVGETSHFYLSTLTAVESRLPPSQFVRIGRSTIINVSRLKEVRLHRHGNCTVILDNGASLALSRGYRNKLDEWIGKR